MNGGKCSTRDIIKIDDDAPEVVRDLGVYIKIKPTLVNDVPRAKCYGNSNEHEEEGEGEETSPGKNVRK